MRVELGDEAKKWCALPASMTSARHMSSCMYATPVHAPCRSSSTLHPGSHVRLTAFPCCLQVGALLENILRELRLCEPHAEHAAGVHSRDHRVGSTFGPATG